MALPHAQPSAGPGHVARLASLLTSVAHTRRAFATGSAAAPSQEQLLPAGSAPARLPEQAAPSATALEAMPPPGDGGAPAATADSSNGAPPGCKLSRTAAAKASAPWAPPKDYVVVSHLLDSARRGDVLDLFAMRDLFLSDDDVWPLFAFWNGVPTVRGWAAAVPRSATKKAMSAHGALVVRPLLQQPKALVLCVAFSSLHI
jgi:hypothetical protein